MTLNLKFQRIMEIHRKLKSFLFMTIWTSIITAIYQIRHVHKLPKLTYSNPFTLYPNPSQTTFVLSENVQDQRFEIKSTSKHWHERCRSSDIARTAWSNGVLDTKWLSPKWTGLGRANWTTLHDTFLSIEQVRAHCRLVAVQLQRNLSSYVNVRYEL